MQLRARRYDAAKGPTDGAAQARADGCERHGLEFTDRCWTDAGLRAFNYNALRVKTSQEANHQCDGTCECSFIFHLFALEH